MADQVCHTDTISALGSRFAANGHVLMANVARLTMLHVHIIAGLR